MICDWNPRPGSNGSASCLCLNLVLVLLLVSVGLAEDSENSKPVLEFAWEGDAGPREKAWVEQDKHWFSGMQPVPDFGKISPDSAADLRSIWQSTLDASSGKTGLSGESLLRNRWFERGYLGVEVRTFPGRDSGPDTLRILPGPHYRLTSLEIGGADFPGREWLLETLLPRPGDAFDPLSFRQGVNRILEEAGEVGFPFARWVISSTFLDHDSGAIALEARLLPGKTAHIGPVTSDVSSGPGRKFLVKASGLKAGALFRNSDLDRAVERLVARDMYQTVGIPDVYLTPAVDTVGIHFPIVERRKVNRVQIVLGLSRKQDDSGSRISGQVDLDLPNLAGTGRRLQVGWRDDGSDNSRFGFSYLEPLAFGTPLDMGVALDHAVETDLFTRFKVDNTWSLPVVASWGLEVGLGWDRSTFPTGDLEGTRRVRALGAVEHQRGDRSRSGWEGRAGLETAWRSAIYSTALDNSEVSGNLGQASTQRILMGDFSGEKWVGSLWSLAGRASYRQLRGEERAAPLSEQFRFGGATTLRGYREDEFHGTSAAWGALELRIGSPRGSRLYTFCDLGYFEFWALDPALSADPGFRTLRRDRPWGFGLGLLARTTGGDLSLAIGFPGTVDFQVAKLHVSLMESF
ncbi:MAG: hypothetical protein KOO60_04260 [Gemmatimonadales bacterium]|nr:hypothetical protein [Gemmatimonadales bacterium]